MPAAAPRAPTRSGRTAGTSTPTDFGLTGPESTSAVLFGGAQIGDSKYWIGDYTVEAENGGLGVFAHEFGHDLGLPDFYDTNAGENGTAFWTLMSSGSWIGDGTEDIGTKPDYMGPWEKLQLGWLDYHRGRQGREWRAHARPVRGRHRRRPDDQAVDNDLHPPYSGTHAGGRAAPTTSTRRSTPTALDLAGMKSATLTAKIWYDIEAGFDFLYARVLDAMAATLDARSAIRSTASSKDNGRRVRYTIPGGTRDTLFRFRYQTDGGVHLRRRLHRRHQCQDRRHARCSPTTSRAARTAGPPTAASRSAPARSRRKAIATTSPRTAPTSATTPALETGPYQFSFALTDPDKVEHFAFEDGLLVWMVDETYTDNNNSEHAGHGLALPVDARPAPFKYGDGTQPSNRRQPFDATFGLQDVPAGRLSIPSRQTPIRRPAALRGPAQAGHRREGAETSRIEYLCAWPTPTSARRSRPSTTRTSTATGTRRTRRTRPRSPATAPKIEVTGRTPAEQCR